MNLNLEDKIWWSYIEEDLQELLVASEFLANVVKSWGGDLPQGSKVFHDYSFVVFPAAKAYEGFLKKMFLDLGFITNEDYLGKRFRIGKALNPFLEERLRDRESVYDQNCKILWWQGFSRSLCGMLGPTEGTWFFIGFLRIRRQCLYRGGGKDYDDCIRHGYGI